MKAFAGPAALLAVLFSALSAPAQEPTVPVPAPIVTAKSVFLSNAGADAGLFPEPFSGDPSRGYRQFYTALEAAHLYQVVNDPSQADLVLELSLSAPNGPSNANKVKGASDPLPQFRLVVYDRRTHVVLWTLTQAIDIAYLQKTHDRNFDQALTTLLAQFAALRGVPPPPATP